MKMKKRQLVYGGLIVVVVAVTIASLMPDRVPVETRLVEQGPMTVTIEARGETRVRDRFVVTAPVSGRIGRIDLREGAQVEPGMLLARITAAPIDPRQREEARARVASAEALRQEAAAAVGAAQSAHGLAARERERAERMVGEGVATEQMLDQARSAEDRARQELAAARQRLAAGTANVAAARATLATPETNDGGRVLEVRAPVSGTIFRVPERSERVVMAGQPILELGDAHQLELVIEVLSEEAVRIRPGQRVVVDRWGGDRPLHGTVRLVEPSAFRKISALGIEEQRVNVIADVSDAPPELGDAYRVEAEIVVWEHDSVVKVPVSALARMGDQWSVFVVENGVARQQPIEIGHRNPLDAEVTAGIEPGREVIVHPGFEIRDGARVRVREGE
jgi:HlyD family secretion protein